MSKKIRLAAVLLILISSSFLLMRTSTQNITPGTARIVFSDGSIVIAGLARTQNPPTTLFTPKTAIDKVLEVPTGFVMTHGIQVGDILDIGISEE